MYVLKTDKQSYLLEGRFTVVGRGTGADIRIDSKTLSREHARFILDQDVLMLEDLSSRNGTFVNGKRLTNIVRVTTADCVRFGEAACTLQEDLSAGGSTEIRIKADFAARVVAAAETDRRQRVFRIRMRSALARAVALAVLLLLA